MYVRATVDEESGVLSHSPCPGGQNSDICTEADQEYSAGLLRTSQATRRIGFSGATLKRSRVSMYISTKLSMIHEPKHIDHCRTLTHPSYRPTKLHLPRDYCGFMNRFVQHPTVTVMLCPYPNGYGTECGA